MANRIHCPICRAKLEISGQQMRCPTCQQTFGAGSLGGGWGGDAVRTEEQVLVKETALQQPPLLTLAHADVVRGDAHLFRPPWRELPGRPLTTVMLVLTGLLLIVQAISFGVEGVAWLERSLNATAANANQSPRAQRPTSVLPRSGAFMEGLLVVFALVLGLIVIVSVLWLYRSHKNLRGLGVQETTFKSIWALPAVLLPFVNLFILYGMLQEIWRGSDPLLLDRRAWRNANRSLGINWWWLCVLGAVSIMGLLWALINFPAQTLPGQPGLPSNAALSLVSSGLLLLSNVVFCFIVCALRHRQTAKLAALWRAAEVGPGNDAPTSAARI